MAGRCLRSKHGRSRWRCERKVRLGCKPLPSATGRRSSEAVVWRGRSLQLVLVALRNSEPTAVMPHHEHQVSPVDLWRPHQGRDYPRQERTRGRRPGAARGRSCRSRSMVDPDGRQRRTGTAVADDRAMPQWRTRLARGGMQSLQDAGKPAARRHPPAARHSALEAGGVAEMPIMPEGSLRAASAHDQADREAGNHAIRLGTSRRGAVSGAAALTPLAALFALARSKAARPRRLR